MDDVYGNILAEQRAARDHITVHGASKESVIWLQDWVMEEILLSESLLLNDSHWLARSAHAK